MMIGYAVGKSTGLDDEREWRTCTEGYSRFVSGMSHRLFSPLNPIQTQRPPTSSPSADT